MNGPTPTRADRKRFRRLQDAGCIACRIESRPNVPPDIHHVEQGDHQKTLPLCPWHHRGVPVEGMSTRAMAEIYGPSLARAKRAFVERYGSELELLEVCG